MGETPCRDLLTFRRDKSKACDVRFMVHCPEHQPRCSAWRLPEQSRPSRTPFALFWLRSFGFVEGKCTAWPQTVQFGMHARGVKMSKHCMNCNVSVDMGMVVKHGVDMVKLDGRPS